MNAPTVLERVNAAPLVAIDGVTVRATPYRWRDPATLPVRPWVYGRWFLRGTIACVVAPGGVGKSTLLAGMALAMVTGKSLLGKTVWNGRQRVWLWNLEDDLDELARSIQAAAMHHRLGAADLDEWLFVDSAMDGAGLCTATDGDGQFKLLTPVYAALVAELTSRKIDVLIIDPFVSSHEVEENANSKIDKIAKAWGRVAKDAGCSIILVHHTSKAGSTDVTAMSARGAVALVNAARSTLVINRMEEGEADRLGIPADERRRYIRVQDDKHNRAPAENANWYRLVSVDLGNGPDNEIWGSDSVAVAQSWTPPDPFENITLEHLRLVQDAIAAGEWRENMQAQAWAGKAVADVLKLDIDRKPDRARIQSLLKTWISNGALKVVHGPDGKRQTRQWIVVGDPVDAAPP